MTAGSLSPEETQAHAPRRARRRPFGIYAIMVLLGLQGLAGVFALVIIPLAASRTTEGFLAALRPQAGELLLLAGEVLFVGVTIVGLWRYKRWAWTMMMLILAYWLTTDLYDYFFAEPRYTSMLLDGIIFFYLNQREVRGLFDPTVQPEAVA